MLQYIIDNSDASAALRAKPASWLADDRKNHRPCRYTKKSENDGTGNFATGNRIAITHIYAPASDIAREV